MSRQFKLMFIFLLLLSSALIGVTVFADDYGLGATAQEAGLAKYESNLPKLVGQVVGAALSLTGVLFFGLMIYSGIIWMIDRGNDERAEQAKNTITAAIIGLVIVLAAYAITKFAFQAVPQTGGGGQGQTASVQLCGEASGSCSGLAVGVSCAIIPTTNQGVCEGPLPACTCVQLGSQPSSCSSNSDCASEEVCKADAVNGSSKQCVGRLTSSNWCCVESGGEGPVLSVKGESSCTGYMVSLAADQCK